MKIALPILFLFGFGLASAQVGGERIYNFLNITTSAAQAALGGETLTINDDVNQPLWNPATISRYMDNQVAVNYVSYLTDGPRITMNSPGNRSRSMPRSACTSTSPI